MKQLLYLFLENSPNALKVLEHLRLTGFNATLIESASLRHAFDEETQLDRHFFNLVQWEETQKNESTLTLFIEEDEELKRLKEMIRNCTDNFKKVKGAMFSLPLSNFEGTI